MKIINPSVRIISYINSDHILKHIEYYARTCYQSVDLIEDMDKTKKFVKSILEKGHESVLEHINITVELTVDRGSMAELTRHRHCAFSVESTRYCNYNKPKFGGLTFIHTGEFDVLLLEKIEERYINRINKGDKAEDARSILPNCLKTNMIMTTNLREWRHVLKLRTSSSTHHVLRGVMKTLLNVLKKDIPIIFDDISVEND